MRKRPNVTLGSRNPLLTLMTVPEVSEHLRISIGTVYRMLKRKTLPAFRLGGEWRFRIEDLERWLDQNSGLAEKSMALQGSRPPEAAPVEVDK